MRNSRYWDSIDPIVGVKKFCDESGERSSLRISFSLYHDLTIKTGSDGDEQPNEHDSVIWRSMDIQRGMTCTHCMNVNFFSMFLVGVNMLY